MSRRTAAIVAACAGGFLAFLDTTIVNTAFPGIAASFPDATPRRLSWVLDAYFIVIAALLLPAGGIADRFGRKRVFLAGVALFVVASVVCAAAPGWQVLVAARALQGAGAAVTMAVSLALILPEFPLARRASAVALWGASAALAAASGPPLGGLLVELDWRWVFAVNVPLGAAVIALGHAALEESRDPNAQGLPDLLGAALMITGLGALALAILEGEAWGWTSSNVLVGLAVAALTLLAAARRCLTHPRPLVDPELLKTEGFAKATLGIFLLGMAFFSTILANVLFLTGVWHYGLLKAGLAVVPGAIATTIAAIPAGRIADRHGHRAVIVPGCLLYVAGMAIVRTAGDTPDFLTTWLPAMALNGAGLGMAFPALAAAALAHVPTERFGQASAVSSAARQFGGVFGTAVLFAIGAPTTLAAADDVYLVSTLWALGAAVVALTLVPTPMRRPHAART
ncbi:DHA2 family efflux MFS transporter permease subunit [Solirubrobacter soli]|uniref:DHA2 family efflux MFS transporter permease subunit n=1 Tax=Solirubrobacter soli TaxID=363832 RepID=UPI0003F5A3D4|nr:DHA2 family efflux MFS transporter permease subunit [Solirubrobacter soli]